jgi:DNA-binding IclR family transcriptional regulator
MWLSYSSIDSLFLHLMTTTGEDRGVRSLSTVIKTLAVLDVLAESPRPVKLAELNKRIGGNRATVYQKLITLVDAGWVEMTDAGTYRLTLTAVRIAEAALNQANLGERAGAVLEALVHETGETASLAILKGAQVQIVKRVEATGVLRAEVAVGGILTLDASASGRVLTAYLSAERLAMLADHGKRLASARVLKQVQKDGYAISAGKDMPEVLAIAVPVFDASDGCFAALSLVVPASRFKSEPLLDPLQKAAEELRKLIARG